LKEEDEEGEDEEEAAGIEANSEAADEAGAEVKKWRMIVNT
jgi:hypothetical protein